MRKCLANVLTLIISFVMGACGANTNEVSIILILNSYLATFLGDFWFFLAFNLKYVIII